MFIPLVDLLRCVNEHADTWLVASIERAEQRHIIRGTLGCPQCLAEYPIRQGIVYFAEDVSPAEYRPPNEEDAVRLAAALDLTEARMTAVLHGEWGAHAPIIARSVAGAVAARQSAAMASSSGDGISIVYANAAPLALGAANAVAIDATASDAMIASLRASVGGHGRVLGPLGRSMPEGLVELARDDEVWVAHLARRRRDERADPSDASRPLPAND